MNVNAKDVVLTPAFVVSLGVFMRKVCLTSFIIQLIRDKSS